MKKILMVTLAALLLLSLAACAAPATPDDASAAPSEAADAPSEGASASADGSVDEPQPAETLFGKVKSLVGNELTLDLAKQPEGSGAPGEGGSYEDSIQSEGGVAVQAPSISVTEKADAGDAAGGEAGGDGDVKVGYHAVDGSGNVTIVNPDNMPKIDLEYTGETKELTIPAGLQIFDMMGKEVKMADLKEGNVLMIMQNEDGSIASIAVME